MRTIKFRGKSCSNGDWFYGNLYDYDKDGRTHICGLERGCLNIDPNTVGQFTGLLDKNGKEIYEDDIVEFVNVNLPDCVIVYDNGSFMYRELGEDISLEELRLQFTVEVIGNIHDNPELMKI